MNLFVVGMMQEVLIVEEVLVLHRQTHFRVTGTNILALQVIMLVVLVVSLMALTHKLVVVVILFLDLFQMDQMDLQEHPQKPVQET